MVPAIACLQGDQVLHGCGRNLLVGDRGRASSPASPGRLPVVAPWKTLRHRERFRPSASGRTQDRLGNRAVPGRAPGNTGRGLSSAWNPLRSRGWCGFSPGCFAPSRPSYRGSAMRLHAVGRAAAAERDARTAGGRNAGCAAGSVHVAHRRITSTPGTEEPWFGVVRRSCRTTDQNSACMYARAARSRVDARRVGTYRRAVSDCVRPKLQESRWRNADCLPHSLANDPCDAQAKGEGANVGCRGARYRIRIPERLLCCFQKVLRHISKEVCDCEGSSRQIGK